jgi:predicted phosphodiesterase
MIRVALLADIHGNALALESVVAHLARDTAPDIVIDLGDIVSGPLWPAETLDIRETLKAATVRGNHDRIVGTGDPATMGASDLHAFEHLTESRRRWLAQLPSTLVMPPGVLFTHASPGRDDAYLLDIVEGGRLVRAAPRLIEERLLPVADVKVVLCGHSHRADLVRLASGITVVNPGSVGCPAYDDPEYPAHVSESGSPHARYATLDIASDGSVAVAFHAIAYPFAEAARRAAANGRPDWEHALLTGRSAARQRQG